VFPINETKINKKITMKKIFLGTALCAVTLLSSCNNGRVNSSLKTNVDTVSYEIGLANTNGIENYFMQMGIDSAYVGEFLKGIRDGAMAGDDKKKQAYYLGVQAGLQISQQMIPVMEQRMFAGDSTKSVSLKNFLAGFGAGISKKSALKIDGKIMTPEAAAEDANKRMMEISATYLEKQYGPQKKAAEAFIQKKSKEAGVKPLGQNVYYKEITAGTGQKPTVKDVVEVNYEGRLTNGQVFDGTSQRNGGKPVDMPVGSVIEGMKIALQQMPVGSEWEIYIPYDKAYGAQGQGPIEPFSPLIFKVKVISIKGASAPATQPVQVQ